MSNYNKLPDEGYGEAIVALFLSSDFKTLIYINAYDGINYEREFETKEEGIEFKNMLDDLFEIKKTFN